MLARHSLLAIAAILWMPCALAQATLGALLDAGAKPLSTAAFNDELVQRMIAGPTPTGGKLEVMYTMDGRMQGTGTSAATTSSVVPLSPVSGDWTADEKGRICTTMRIGAWASGSVVMTRCQYWFKLGNEYYFADSDVDRSAKVLKRTIKQ